MVLKTAGLFLVLFLKTPLAWGFSIERTENYLNQAKLKNLSQSAEWIRLGHYKKTLLGNYKSKIKGSFFIHDSGDQNPAAELESSIRHFFDPATAVKDQCRYLARMSWLQKVIEIHPEDIVHCAERDSWKAKLNAQEAYLVFASSDLNSAASSFGHTFIRFHNPDNKGSLDLIDYGVNFAAETRESDGILFALKGLFGMYPGYYSLMPYHQKLKDYINLEGRDIWEYKMNLSANQVEQMINHLLELEGSYVPYYFVDDNCSYQILELIEVARPDLDLSSHFRDATIPLDTLKILARQNNFLSGERLRPSLVSEFQGDYSKINSQQKDQVVSTVEAIRKGEAAQTLQLSGPSQEKAQTLDVILSYLAIQEYREQKNYKDWKYQIAVERARLGMTEKSKSALAETPLSSHDTSALYLGVGSLGAAAFTQLKWRRAFHDVISRDQGISPFSSIEVLSFDVRYLHGEKRLDLHRFQALQILSTKAVTRLEKPWSWKTSLGTEPQWNPFFEGGLGYSFDLNMGARSRWVQLLIGRTFLENDKGYGGLGTESLFIQQWAPSFRSLQSAKYLGVANRIPFVELEAALSMDLSKKLEARLSFQRSRELDTYLLSFIF